MRVKIIFRISFFTTLPWRRTEIDQRFVATSVPVRHPAPVAMIPENKRSIASGAWVVDYPQGTWECRYTLLESLASEAMKGFERSPAGGVELGGVLYGTRTGQHVQVTANRSVVCEHRNGPAFTLSEDDKAGLDALVAEASGETTGLTPVGWYHTAYCSLDLARGTAAILSRWFPDPWQAVLVFRRERGEPVQVGFFARDATGAVGFDPAHKITLDAMDGLSRLSPMKEERRLVRRIQRRIERRFRRRNGDQQDGIVCYGVEQSSPSAA
jgi:hypothetical protein